MEREKSERVLEIIWRRVVHERAIHKKRERLRGGAYHEKTDRESESMSQVKRREEEREIEGEAREKTKVRPLSGVATLSVTST